MNLNSLIQTIGKKLYEKNVFGYCSVDLVSFPDPEHDQQLFWALGLKCYMDNAAATTLYFDFMMNGKLNQVTGEYFISDEDSSDKDNENRMIGKLSVFLSNFIRNKTSTKNFYVHPSSDKSWSWKDSI